MALDKDAFLSAAFRKSQKIGKGLKVMEPTAFVIIIKESIHDTWKRMEGSRLYEHFFVYILHPSAHLYSLVFFPDLQALNRGLFTQVHFARITYIYICYSAIRIVL